MLCALTESYSSIFLFTFIFLVGFFFLRGGILFVSLVSEALGTALSNVILCINCNFLEIKDNLL